MTEEKWPTDRSRFLDGFACPWKRLLKYHAFGTGIERRSIYAPLQTGLTIHKGLELILRNGATTKEQVSAQLAEPIRDYVDKLKDVSFEDPATELRTQVAVTEALCHAYARIAVPWLKENFDIVSIEESKAVELPEGIIWRSREDFLTRHKLSQKLAIHDFKSSSYFNADNVTDEWADSLQQMLNAYVASINYGQRVEAYYIHILVKGSKRSPSYLTHPYYRPANPPLVTEDIVPQYTSKKGYARVFAPDIPIPIADWVWSVDASYAAKAVPIIGPFEVNYAKVERFLAGLPNNEKQWILQLAGLDWSQWSQAEFQNRLDSLFPRTYNCFEFGGRKCQFYSICHRQPGWDDPLGSKQYARRSPHHLIGESFEETE